MTSYARKFAFFFLFAKSVEKQLRVIFLASVINVCKSFSKNIHRRFQGVWNLHHHALTISKQSNNWLKHKKQSFPMISEFWTIWFVLVIWF